MKYHITTLALSLSLITIPVLADDGHDHSAHEKEAATSQPAETKDQVRIGDAWPLDTCVVSGEKLGSMGDPIIMLHEGREVRFCCKGCVGMFEKDPAKYLSAADEKIKEQQKENFPLDYCIIDTNEAISEVESENAYSVVGNRLFVYCCPPCDKKVQADPEKYIEILDQAIIKKQSASYPTDMCLVSGDKLGGDMGEPINYIYNGELVKLCCKGCIKMFEKNPQTYLSKLHSNHDTDAEGHGAGKDHDHDMHSSEDSDEKTENHFQ